MREIKFRAWDGKKMHIWGFIEKDAFSSPPSLSNQKGMFQLEQMQYTGLRDKKRTAEYPDGQEIYEGDVITIENWPKLSPFAVTFRDGAFALSSISSKGSPLLLAMVAGTDRIEVISNIHEHPELLK